MAEKHTPSENALRYTFLFSCRRATPTMTDFLLRISLRLKTKETNPAGCHSGSRRICTSVAPLLHALLGPRFRRFGFRKESRSWRVPQKGVLVVCCNFNRSRTDVKPYSSFCGNNFFQQSSQVLEMRSSRSSAESVGRAFWISSPAFHCW